MRAEVLQRPDELGRRLDDTLGEVLVRAARPEFVIAALVPMPAGSMRIKAENFFPLDIDAEGRAPQGDRILIPCNDVDRRLESDLITGS